MRMNPQDLQRIMQQAQQMQAELTSVQEALAAETYEGTAGGGVVKAVVRGSGDLVSVEIAPPVIDPDDPEMLGDLVVAAVNQAHGAAQKAAEEQLGSVTGGVQGMLD